MPDTQLPPDILSDEVSAELKLLMATGEYASGRNAIAAERGTCKRNTCLGFEQSDLKSAD
jgi:hypothetical protein